MLKKITKTSRYSLFLMGILIGTIFLGISTPAVKAATTIEDSFENNDTFGTASYLGNGFWKNLCQADDDFYTRYINLNTYINITIWFDGGSSNLNLYLYNQAQVLIYSSETINNKEHVSYYTGALSGTFYFKVNGTDASEAYDMEFYTYKFEGNDDGMEENDIHNRAVPINTNTTYTNLKNYDVDYFKFPVQPGDTISITSDHNSGFHQYLYLHNDQNNWVQSGTNTTATQHVLSYTSTYVGELFLNVTGWTGDWYNLRVNLFRFDDGFEVNNLFTEAQSLSLNNYFSGLYLNDIDYFKVTVNPDSCFNFNLTTTNHDLKLTIYNSSFVSKGEAEWTGTNVLSIQLIPTYAGDCFIVVNQTSPFNHTSYGLNVTYCECNSVDNDGLEPNNLKTQATNITAILQSGGTTTTDHSNLILNENGVDYFSYNAKSGDYVGIIVHLHSAGDILIQFLDYYTMAVMNSTSSSSGSSSGNTDLYCSYNFSSNQILLIKLTTSECEIGYDFGFRLTNINTNTTNTGSGTNTGKSNTSTNSTVPADNPFGSVDGYSTSIVILGMTFSMLAIILTQKKNRKLKSIR
jgi:hypothetical protein